MFAWRVAIGQATGLLYLLSVFAHSGLKIYPEVILGCYHSFKGDGKTPLNACCPVQVLISHSSLACPLLFALPCLSQDVHFQLFLCFTCTTKELKTYHQKEKAGFLEFEKDYNLRLYRDQKWHSKFFRHIWKWCLIIVVCGFLVGYTLRAKSTTTTKNFRCHRFNSTIGSATLKLFRSTIK